MAIPLRLIADKWLEYFWPLFESPSFIPQKRGEKRGCLKPVMFRAELNDLINLYRGTGGLCRFSVEYRGNALAPAAATAHRKAVSRIADAIRNGPVFRHVRMELQPLNPDYAPIVTEQADEGALRVVGEFVAVTQSSPAASCGYGQRGRSGLHDHLLTA